MNGNSMNIKLSLFSLAPLFTVLLMISPCHSTAQEQEVENLSEEESTPPTSLFQDWKGRSSVGVQVVTWIESLRLEQGSSITKDNANFYGTALSFEKDLTKGRWGIGSTAGVMFGRANGGGDNSLDYNSGRLAWTGGILGLRSYYRWSGQVATGLQLPLLIRQVTWPTENNTKASSGNTLNYSLLFEIKIRINKKWEMSSAIGPNSSQGGSFWRAGLNWTL